MCPIVLGVLGQYTKRSENLTSISKQNRLDLSSFLICFFPGWKQNERPSGNILRGHGKRVLWQIRFQQWRKTIERTARRICGWAIRDGRGFKFENGNEIMEHVRGMLIDKEPDWISTDNEYETATLWALFYKIQLRSSRQPYWMYSLPLFQLDHQLYEMHR